MQGKDLVVVTIEQYRVPELVDAAIFDGVPAETIVIETNNYYPRQRDGRIAAIEEGLTESEWVSGEIGRAVIKVFNNIYFKHLRERGQAAGTPGRIGLPVAGDDLSPSAWSCPWSMRSGSMRSTPGRWPSPGVSSRERRCTALILTPPVFAKRSRRRRPSVPRTSARRRTRPRRESRTARCCDLNGAPGTGRQFQTTRSSRSERPAWVHG